MLRLLFIFYVKCVHSVLVFRAGTQLHGRAVKSTVAISRASDTTDALKRRYECGIVTSNVNGGAVVMCAGPNPVHKYVTSTTFREHRR